MGRLYFGFPPRGAWVDSDPSPPPPPPLTTTSLTPPASLHCRGCSGSRYEGVGVSCAGQRGERRGMGRDVEWGGAGRGGAEHNNMQMWLPVEITVVSEKRRCPAYPCKTLGTVMLGLRSE
ncbi:hypothetical protein E2C01_030629 [Portunus trituberculatus]|uniref:Uncharacterized protein n=1 Tax=Portunus trituberculatus TaxID=210409 RepID=A0A5B7EUR0_PORTR|nr:hypothetical protein [Portunus trituberculatus]